MDTFQQEVILSSLKEDLFPKGDITSESIIPSTKKSTFELVVNEDAILAGLDVFKKVFLLLDKNILIDSNFKNGDRVCKKQVVANISGNTVAVLKGERTALNFISHLSGIATLTHQLVQLIKHTNVVLLDTRKTTPNLRFFEKQAVLAGGGKNHRLNLSDMVLIKDNHVDLVGDIKKAVSNVRKTTSGRVKLELEVRNIKELKEAIASSVDIIMFDNWKVSDLKKAVKLVPTHILTEASGQISLKNIRAYAECGVNYISTSYMTKNARWVDFSLKAKKQRTESVKRGFE